MLKKQKTKNNRICTVPPVLQPKSEQCGMMRMGIYASGKKAQHVTGWLYARRQMEPPDVSLVQIITQYVKKNRL